MSTGWKWISSDGEEFKSQLKAREYLRDRPDIRMYFSEITMAGIAKSDVTDALRDSLSQK